MGDARRWSVTYTKHVKQKRKVYQDGFLELQSASHKVVLYDDCEKLLDSRFVKMDDVVRLGETLTFGAYLVDIGDPEGEQKPKPKPKPKPNLNLQEREKKISEKAGSLHGQKFKNSLHSDVNWKTSPGMNKAPSSNLSPSQKIIREFKKSEISKYGVSPSCPDTVKKSTAEWQVMYTTQITQKAKKFHDGALKVVTCGSQTRQAMLYDATGAILDSRFLKKDETIRSGEFLKFDGHLVDIGECEGDHKPLVDLNLQGGNCNVVKKTKTMQGQQVQTHTASSIEWEAMYTSQITQKSKKYHCGILRLASCGSYQKKVTLLAEDGTILSRKYLKLSEDVRTGSTLQLPSYPVEVGEQRKHPQVEPRSEGSSWEENKLNARSSDVDNITLSRRAPANKPFWCGELPKNALLQNNRNQHIESSAADNIESNRRVPATQPLRNAHAIMSFLKKPATQDGICGTEEASVEGCYASQSSDVVHSHLMGRLVQDSSSKRSAVKDHDQQISTMHNSGGEIVRSETVCNEILSKTSASVDFDERGDQEAKVLTSFSFAVGAGKSNISKSMLDVDVKGTGGSNKMPVCHIVEPQVLVDCNLNHDGQSGIVSVPHDGLNQDMESGSFPELLSSKVASRSSVTILSKEVNPESTLQSGPGDIRLNITLDGAFGFGIGTSVGCTPQDSCDGKRNYSEQISTRITDDCPTFDLGF